MASSSVGININGAGSSRSPRGSSSTSPSRKRPHNFMGQQQNEDPKLHSSSLTRLMGKLIIMAQTKYWCRLASQVVCALVCVGVLVAFTSAPAIPTDTIISASSSTTRTGSTTGTITSSRGGGRWGRTGKITSSPVHPRTLFYYFSADTEWADGGGPIRQDKARAAGERLALREGAELDEPMSDKVDALMRRTERRKRSEKIGRYMREVPEAPCDYQHDWQKTSFPQCNGIHESFGQGDPVPFLINNGGWVDIFAIMEYDGSMKVLKTKRYRHEFTDRNFDRYRRDALAMERLTSAPNVLNIYGFCGVTAVVDYADGGDIENFVNDLLDKYDNDRGLQDRDEMSPEYEQIQLQKLRIATQVLTSIATMHNFDKEGQASISHTDISPYQFIKLDGKGFVLNDFNRARWITWNKQDDVPCGFRVANNPGKWRAPEEYAYEIEDEKIDVYSAGNVLYYLLTLKKPFDDEDQKDAKKMVMKGKRPPLPKRFREPTHRVDLLLLKAMNWCWTHDPAERPCARAVADLLENELGSIEKKQKHGGRID